MGGRLPLAGHSPARRALPGGGRGQARRRHLQRAETRAFRLTYPGAHHCHQSQAHTAGAFAVAPVLGGASPPQAPEGIGFKPRTANGRVPSGGSATPDPPASVPAVLAPPGLAGFGIWRLLVPSWSATLSNSWPAWHWIRGSSWTSLDGREQNSGWWRRFIGAASTLGIGSGVASAGLQIGTRSLPVPATCPAWAGVA